LNIDWLKHEREIKIFGRYWDIINNTDAIVHAWMRSVTLKLRAHRVIILIENYYAPFELIILTLEACRKARLSAHKARTVNYHGGYKDVEACVIKL
jgi:hypothetical protein